MSGDGCHHVIRWNVGSPGFPLPHGSLQEVGVDSLPLVGLLHILTDKL